MTWYTLQAAQIVGGLSLAPGGELWEEIYVSQYQFIYIDLN